MRSELRRTLALLHAGNEAAGIGGDDDLAEFASAAADSPYALHFDWKLTNAAILEELVARFGRAHPLDISTRNDECEISAVDAAGVRWSVRLPTFASLPRDALVAAFVDLLPTSPVAFKLVYFEGSDSDEYLIVDRAIAESILDALGTAGPQVLRRLEP